MKSLIYRSLGKITKHPQEQRNIISLGFSELIKSADLPLFSGTELQAFQVRAGLGNAQIGVLGSVGQISMAVATFLSMWFADRVKNRVRANVWLTAGMVIYPLVMVILSLGPAFLRRPSFIFPTMFTLEVAEKLVMGMTGTLYATLFARSISNEVRGRFTGIIGVVGGIIGIVCGLISSWALKQMGFPHGFTVAFVLGVGLLSIATYAVKHVREIPELSSNSVLTNDAEPEVESVSVEAESEVVHPSPLENIWNIIRMKEFKLLAPPNILRGLGDGAGYFAMAVGIRNLGLGNEYAGYTTALIFLGAILGTTWIGFTVDKYGPGLVLFAAEAMIAVSLVGIAMSPSAMFFIIFFLFLQINMTVEGYTVPLAHYAIVPVSVIGGFSGIRLMLLYATTAITTYYAGSLMHTLGIIPIFIGCAFLKFSTGALYLRAFKKGHKYVVPAEETESSAV